MRLAVEARMRVHDNDKVTVRVQVEPAALTPSPPLGTARLSIVPPDGGDPVPIELKTPHSFQE